MTEKQQHPITPPPELILEWTSSLYGYTQAARWGADQELNECCHLLRRQGFDVVDDLRATRRPKPPSLKEQALQRLAEAELTLIVDPDGIIRRALEQLDD